MQDSGNSQIVRYADDPKNSPTMVRYFVLAFLCFAAGLAYLHRGCLGVLAEPIGKELEISDNQMGIALGLFFWTYALFQIPTGILVDRWGARRSLLLFGMLGGVTIALGASTLVLGASVGLIVLCVSRALLGIAQAGLFPASTRCLAVWFPIERRSAAAGTLQAFMSIGAAVGAIITAKLFRWNIGWSWIFLLYALPAILWSFWFFSYYRDKPSEHSGVNESELELLQNNAEQNTPKPSSEATPWLGIFLSGPVFWLCLSQFFRAGANVFWMTWCPKFLTNTYKVDAATAGELSSITFIGVVTGSFLGGVLADRIYNRTKSKRQSRQGVAISTAIIGIGFFALAYLIPTNIYVAIGLLFLAAIFTSGANPCSYSVSMDIGGRYMAIVFGAMNMCGNFGAAIVPSVIPPWTKELGWASMPLFMALLYAVGVIGWCFVDPSETVEERMNKQTDVKKSEMA